MRERETEGGRDKSLEIRIDVPGQRGTGNLTADLESSLVQYLVVSSQVINRLLMHDLPNVFAEKLDNFQLIFVARRRAGLPAEEEWAKGREGELK